MDRSTITKLHNPIRGSILFINITCHCYGITVYTNLITFTVYKDVIFPIKRP